METSDDDELDLSFVIDELMEYDKEYYSIPEFIEYLKQPDLLWLPAEREEHRIGLIFWSPNRYKIASTNYGSANNCDAVSTSSNQYSSIIQDRIKRVFMKITSKWHSASLPCLVQFWAPEEKDGRTYLTTSKQPFALTSPYKRLCWHRKHSMDHVYFVDDGAKVYELGPLGRVFKTGQTESSPDVRLYSIEEHPQLLDHSVQCGLTQLLALPVFDSLTGSGQCVGVLEILYTNTGYSMASDFKMIQQALKASSRSLLRVREERLGDRITTLHQLVSPFGKADTASVLSEAISYIKFLESQIQLLRLLYLGGMEGENTRMNHSMVADEDSTLQLVVCPISKMFDFVGTDQDMFNGRALAWNEMKEMLKLVIEAPQLQLVQVWVPKEIHHSNLNESWKNRMVRAAFIHDSSKVIDSVEGCDTAMIEFLEACKFHVLQPGKGIAGRILESENKLIFGQNLSDFTITEYPLAHYTKRARLDICFAISLKSAHTGSDNPCVLEFYLYKESKQVGYIQSFLHFLFPLMKQQLKSFKVSSGQDLGEELANELIILCEDTEIDYAYPSRYKNAVASQEKHSENSKKKCTCCKSSAIDANGRDKPDCDGDKRTSSNRVRGKEIPTDKSKREGNKMSFRISPEDLKRHQGKRLEEAAEELGVSRSTLKRACRESGINRWPSHPRNKKNPSLFETKNANKRCHRASSSNDELPASQLPLHRTAVPNTSEMIQTLEGELVMVKARYAEDILKFQHDLSWGMEKLVEGVASRLNMETGSFKLKYVDEDEDEILLACDMDLQLCVNAQKTLGKTFIQVLVQSVSK